MRKPCRPHVSRPSTFFARSLLSAFSPAPDEQTAEMIKEKRRRSRSWSVSNLRKRAAIIRLREKGKNEKGKKIRSTTLRRRPGALRACLSLSLSISLSFLPLYLPLSLPLPLSLSLPPCSLFPESRGRATVD